MAPTEMSPSGYHVENFEDAKQIQKDYKGVGFTSSRGVYTMEINRATGLEEHIRYDVKNLKKLILKIEAIAQVCRNQPASQVKREYKDYVEELEDIHFNAKHILDGDIFR